VKSTILAILLVAAGVGAGFFLGTARESGGTARDDGGRGTTLREASRLEYFGDEEELARLRAEIERLKAELEAARAALPAPEVSPYPDDRPEDVERLLEAAYGENNIDWLLQVLERLLLLGDEGYPLLRRMLEDIIFKAKFLPSESDFRPDQFYTLGKIFTKHEKKFIGFLNYLLTEPGTNPYFQQGAMVAGAWYVGSKAPGSEELQQTLMQRFLEQGATGLPAGVLPGEFGKRMQVWSIAMSGDPRAVGPLRAELKKTKNKELQGDILGALAYLGDPQVLPEIEGRLDPMQGDYRRELQALGRLDTPEADKVATNFIRSIPDSPRFYQHARRYMRQGGGGAAVLLMKERIQSNPADPEIRNVVGTLERYPTPESKETLEVIATTSPDAEVARSAAAAAEEVGKRLRGEIPVPGQD